MKRRREEEEAEIEEKKEETTKTKMEIVWQTPAHPAQKEDYIFHNGKRHVRPYHFEFVSHVNKRWEGKTIVDLFAHEFRGRSRDYYVNAVKCGRIQVDGENIPVSYIVKRCQKISHFLHRHEPPVMAYDVTILQNEPDVLTVCKPASVPVHPCGQYRKNTVLGILEAEHGLAPLYTGLFFFLDINMSAIHRLDRLVSGLLIIAKTPAKANSFRQHIEGGVVKKQYVAKVVGVFPDGEKVVDANIDHNPREGRSTAVVGISNGDTTLKGKSACTKFTRISTNGTHSIVLCEPITGRTHQIRVHLQCTGHPIANDMLYLSDDVVDRSTLGTTADRAAALSGSPRATISENNKEEYKYHSEDFSIDPMCTHCPNLAPDGYDGHEEGLWLHCVRYSGPGWAYECPYPDWASLD
ncbi:Pseudouridine synthase, RsuA/RluB/C/D/E/F [Corchorus capsularis]|uniref:Pseudouridine synthase n=1 Tax=Corchorus capsularis TaxID=210143 RepID=A0A1R3JX52_COCAP|nr:Pseudouridine synthase, RsuA/RluB/C/D/E/F [Corchorus capsularis]